MEKQLQIPSIWLTLCFLAVEIFLRRSNFQIVLLPPKSGTPTKQRCFSRKHVLLCNTFLCSTLDSTFSFMLFHMAGSRETLYNCFKGDKRERICFIVVLTKQFMTFSHHKVHNSFFTIHNIFSQLTAEPNRLSDSCRQRGQLRAIPKAYENLDL